MVKKRKLTPPTPEELLKGKRKRGRPKKYHKVQLLPTDGSVKVEKDKYGYWGSRPFTSESAKVAIQRLPIAHELRALAKMYAPEAILKVVEIMRTTQDERACLVAIQLLLDRGLGKVKELVEEKDIKPVDVSVLSADDLSKLRETLGALVRSRDNAGSQKTDDEVPDSAGFIPEPPSEPTTPVESAERGLVPVGAVGLEQQPVGSAGPSDEHIVSVPDDNEPQHSHGTERAAGSEPAGSDD